MCHAATACQSVTVMAALAVENIRALSLPEGSWLLSSASDAAIFCTSSRRVFIEVKQGEARQHARFAIEVSLGAIERINRKPAKMLAFLCIIMTA